MSYLKVFKIILRKLGFIAERPIYHDLDHLAGTWSAEEAKEFKEAIQQFEQIDTDETCNFL